MATIQCKPLTLNSLWMFRESALNFAGWAIALAATPLAAPGRAFQQAKDWQLAGESARTSAVGARQMRTLGKDMSRFLRGQFEAQQRLYEEFLRGEYRTLEEAKVAWAVTRAAQQALAEEAVMTLRQQRTLRETSHESG